MPEEPGILPARVNPYERNNPWQLYTAISWGAEKVPCILRMNLSSSVQVMFMCGNRHPV